jgi:hypothetical protein
LVSLEPLPPCFYHLVFFTLEYKPTTASFSSMTCPAIDCHAAGSMACYAPTHFKGRRAGRACPALGVAMTVNARDTACQMAGMGKIDKVGKSLKLHPWNGLTLFPVDHKRFGQRRLARKRAMAINTELNRWDSGDARNFSIPVAKPAVDTQLTGMPLMAKGDRLSRCR